MKTRKPRSCRRDPIFYRINDLTWVLGLGLTTIKQLIKDKKLDKRKYKKCTVVTSKSVRRFAAGLPRGDEEGS
jgi:hypothetical protein